MRPRRAVAHLERRLGRIARPGDRPADRRVAADVEERRSLADVVRRFIAEAELARGMTVQPLVEEELVPEPRDAEGIGQRLSHDARARGEQAVGGQVVAGRIPGNVGAADRDRIDVVAARERVAGEQLILRRQVGVDASAGLVVIVVADHGLAVDGRRDVAERIEVDDIARHRIDRGRRNLVIGNRHAACGKIYQRHRHAGEVALPFLRRRHRRGGRQPLTVAEALVVAEEERAVRAQRSARGRAELMLVQRLDFAREEVARVERVVAHELVGAAVQLVAPAARHHARRCAGGAAVFGRGALRQDAELGDRIDRDLQRIAAVHAVHVLRAVHQVDVLLRPHAVDGVGLALPQRSTGGRHPGGERRHAGLQQPELREVAAVQRQVDELASGHDAPQGVRRGVDDLRAAADRDGLLDRRQLQLHVQPHRLADGYDNGLAHGRAEARGGDGHAVGADRQQRQAIETVCPGRRLAAQTRFALLGGDRRGNGTAGAIVDRTLDGAGRVLGEDRRRRQKEAHE